MVVHNVLIDGEWRQSSASGTFRAQNPATGDPFDDEYPISSWSDCDAALDAAVRAADALRGLDASKIADFLRAYADRLDARQDEICELAHRESGLPKSPRLSAVELPRTTNQLRQAADAAAEGSWSTPTIDTKASIRSYFAGIGPVVVFGPNNFPLAFSGVAGGDFAAAIAAGNPVIAKGHPIHPGTARTMAEEAFAALRENGLPPATLQLIYKIDQPSGLKLVSDKRTGATGFTGSRTAGLKLKAAADAAGKPVYVELSSINPVLILPGALSERGPQIAEEFAGSCLLGGGQFCTNPGLVVLLEGGPTDEFIAATAKKFETSAPPPLLSNGVVQGLTQSVSVLRSAGADLVVGGTALPAPGCRFSNTLLRVTAERFLRKPEQLQTEAFGSASLFVVARDISEAAQVVQRLEGSLTGTIYTSKDGSDDRMYDALAPLLRRRAGRLLNDKMPTGVAVSPAMNHGGPYPATGHPGFTAVGIPAAIRRFAVLECFDNVRPARLPAALQDKNPNGRMWRLIDGNWTQRDV
jgi:NADP-dependent aldehyde dehydrogenase